MKSAIVELQSLRSKLQSREEPIAIVGLACRVPGADTPEALWTLLEEQHVAAQREPEDRWDNAAFYDPDPEAPGKSYLRSGSFLSNVDGFDADFFGISPREAVKLDPQQRLLMEVSWEALENAGVAPERLSGTATGVFMGVMNNEYVHHRVSQIAPGDFDSFVGTGNESSFLAGRVSYHLGLTGPSLVVATACSSSLVTVHLACQSIRNGECDLALAGGVNLLLSPYTNVALCKMRAVAEDGRSKTFSGEADGYGRGEGCGVVVLKRLSAAVRDRDRILGVVRGSALGHNGASVGLTVPNGPSQTLLIGAALAAAKARAEDLDYVEMHGTGTVLGDPIEIRALAAALGGRRQPLPVGALKSNIGHLESAAGVAGLAKVLMAMRHRTIPGQPVDAAPNPHIPWDEIPVYVPSKAAPWTVSGKRRLAGISSFGLSGSNAHVIVEEAPDVESAGPPAVRAGLVVLSAKTNEALVELAAAYADHFASYPDMPWMDVCYTSQSGRSHFEHRLAVLASSCAEAQAKLRAFASVGSAPGVYRGFSEAAPKVAFLFSGQGSQYRGMARELDAVEPVFREALDRCDAVLEPLLGVPLRDILASEDLDQTRFTQPAIFALEYALAELWRAWGVTPAILLGHSVGECAAACVAGVFRLEDGLRLIVERSRLMQSLPGGGAMAAVLAEEHVVRAALGPARGVDIAALNGPRSVVISGPAASVAAVTSDLSRDGVEAVPLNVSHAFHSALMDPILDSFETVVRTLRMSPAKIHVVSNETGRVARPMQLADAAYWRRHIRQAVQFQAGMATLREQNVDVYLEVGPKPVLVGMGRQCVPADPAVAWLPSLRPGQGDAMTMLGSLAELYVRGAEIAWERVTQGRVTTLPTYRFQRRRYWLETPAPAAGRENFAAALQQLVADAESCTELNADQKALLPELFAWMGRKLQPSKSDVVFDYYNALSNTDPAFVQSAEKTRTAPFLTFGPLPQIVPGFSWLVTLAHPEQYPAFVALSRRAQETMRDLLFREVDFSACRRLLDFGCGYGSDLIRVAEQNPWTECNGYTISSEQARIGRASAADRGLSTRVHIHHRDSAADAFPEGLDLAFGFEVVHHIKDKPALFRNLAAHLNDGAYLVLADFISNAEFAIEHAETSSYFITRGEWVELLSQHGFELCAGIDISQEVANYLHDPNFNENLAQITEAGLDVNIKSALESYNGLGRLLRKGLASYVLLTARRRTEGTVEAMSDANGQILAKLASFSQSAPDQWLYRREWRPSASETRRVPLPAGTIVVGEGSESAALASQLGMRLTATAELPTALRDAVECRHVIVLSALATQDADDVPATIGGALRILQGIVESGRSPRVWLVRRADAVEQAPFDGLGAVVELEHAELSCTRVELPATASAADADLLASELGRSTHESQVSFRSGSRTVARLARAEAPPAEPLALHATGTYLITGGFGALGLLLAEGMIRAGARHLVLTGRSGARGREAELARLVALGATVEAAAVDVADSGQVQALLRTLPDLRGVVHAAGVLDDGVLMNQTGERFARVLAPKVAGGWNLHLATRQRSLDFFVCFSSLASLIGTPGQGSYAAGNAFLDALCERRRREGLPAISIQWGPWSGSGMAANNEGAARLAGKGVESLGAGLGVSMFLRLLAEQTATVGVAAVNWQRFPDTGVPYFAECIAPPDSGRDLEAQGELRRQLAVTVPANRRTLLVAYLKKEVARVLERETAPSARQGFADMGVDSLMAIELRNSVQTALGMALPATLLFKCPNIDDLAAFLEAECSPPAAAMPETRRTDEPSISATDTDDEIAAELERLNALMQG